jgi:hypothetical protein
VDFHHAEPAGSRGLHSAVVAEGGNVDGVLPGHLQNGPAIFTADFQVIYGEIDHVPSSTSKKYKNLAMTPLLVDIILSKYEVVGIFFFMKQSIYSMTYFFAEGVRRKCIMPKEMTQCQFYAGVAGENILPG